MVSPTLLRADNITYNIDQAVGAGSVTGTLTTDGTIGVLNTGGVNDGPVGFAGNIVDVNLVLSDGTNTEPLSGDIFSSVGSDLIASATDLTFDFGRSLRLTEEYESIFRPMAFSGWFAVMLLLLFGAKLLNRADRLR